MQESAFIGYIIPCFPLLPPDTAGFMDISLQSFRDKKSIIKLMYPFFSEIWFEMQ